MYSFLQGKLVEKNPAYAVIDCNGVGFMLHISLNTFTQIKNNENCRLFTHLYVREDAMMLFGFSAESERTLFRHLISVSGVGVNTARIILSTLTTNETVNAILSEDISTLKKVKGIGPKAAQRLVLDLKDKLVKDNMITEKVVVPHNTIRDAALSGLTVLGFPRNVAVKVLDKILADSEAKLSVEELIKCALKVL